MRDEDMRLEAKRLADVVRRLAADPQTRLGTRDGRYCIEDVVATSGADEICIRYDNDGQQLSGSDAAGPIKLGLQIDSAHIDRARRTLRHVPAEFVDIATLLSDTVTSNPALRHVDLHIVLGPSDAWEAAAAMLQDASDAHPDLTLRVEGGTTPGMRLQMTAKGGHGVDGPSAALAEAIAALPAAPVLTWKRSLGPQALAKRRQNGVPPMGRAIIRPALVTWKPHAKAPTSEGAAHVVRPAVPVARVPSVPIDAERRFDWTLDDWQDVTCFAQLEAEVQQALMSILVVNERMLMQQLELVRRQGRWVQRYAARDDVPELSYEHARILLDVGILEHRDDMLAGGWHFHRLLRGLVATGYDSWAGVAQIRRVEQVPKGLDYEPPGYGYLRNGEGRVARLNDSGFTLERLRFSPTTPTLARNGYAKAGITSADPLIAVVSEGGMMWPDFTRDIPSEIDGRIGVACEPELDARVLPGPMGRIYRAPAEDRMLIRRYLRSHETRGSLEYYNSWRVDYDEG